jgi:hypothetical protein
MAASIWAPGTTVTPTLPAVAPVQFVKGTALLPGITFVGDIETGIWSSADGFLQFTVNGVTRLTIDPIGQVTFANKAIFGVEVDIASSTVTDIGALGTNSCRITGINGITSFGTTYAGPMFVRFEGAVTLAHSATLILPGATNITTVAGDTLIAMPKATAGVADGWAVVSFTRSASSGSGGGGATGGGADEIFYLNDKIMTASYTLPNNKNASLVGPLTVGTGLTLTVPSGQRLVVL